MEKIYIECDQVEVSFLDKQIIRMPHLAIHQFDRIGIVGRNGSGKTTLLKLLAGEIEADRGHIHRLVDFGYFDQLSLPTENEMNYEAAGKLSVPARDIEFLSGGEQTRKKLAQLFSYYSEGLLLDEPTTHLDASGRQLLIEKLTHFRGAIVIVSHDRSLLDQLVTKIWEIENAHVTEYVGNYSDYMKQKELEKTQQQEKYETYLKERSRLQQAAEEKMNLAEKITKANLHISKKETKAKANKMFMTKSKDTGQKSVHRAAKALEQRMEQMSLVEMPKDEQKLTFEQPKALQLHTKYPIMADRLTLNAGEKPLFQEVSFQFPLGKTIAITGDNGTGKSTLLRAIVNSVEGIITSPKVVIGYYEQMEYQFTKDQSVMAYMFENSDYAQSKIEKVLNEMNFIGNDLRKNIRQLSGGEAIRLVLCQLFLGRYNVLILDEPTNFLDIASIEALEKCLQAYDGTIIFVSHDETFIEHVADIVFTIDQHQLKMLR